MGLCKSGEPMHILVVLAVSCLEIPKWGLFAASMEALVDGCVMTLPFKPAAKVQAQAKDGVLFSQLHGF
eukprot:6208480-Pleurochrysis_carterae.AAC.3